MICIVHTYSAFLGFLGTGMAIWTQNWSKFVEINSLLSVIWSLVAKLYIILIKGIQLIAT